MDDSQNLKLRRINANFITKGINHDLKTFEIYYWKNNKSYIYNRFNDCYINLGEVIGFSPNFIVLKSSIISNYIWIFIICCNKSSIFLVSYSKLAKVFVHQSLYSKGHKLLLYENY